MLARQHKQEPGLPRRSRRLLEKNTGPKSFFEFLQLPPEIRNSIYKLVFLSSNKVGLDRFNILLCSKQIHHEAVGIAYSRSTHVIPIQYEYPATFANTWTGSREARLWRRLRPEIAALVTRVRLVETILVPELFQRADILGMRDAIRFPDFRNIVPFLKPLCKSLVEFEWVVVGLAPRVYVAQPSLLKSIAGTWTYESDPAKMQIDDQFRGFVDGFYCIFESWPQLRKITFLQHPDGFSSDELSAMVLRWAPVLAKKRTDEFRCPKGFEVQLEHEKAEDRLSVEMAVSGKRSRAVSIGCRVERCINNALGGGGLAKPRRAGGDIVVYSSR